MALTKDLALPSAPQRGTSWSVRRLFGSGADGLGVVIKQHRPMEFAFIFMVASSFILELFRSYPSWEWWVLLGFVFVGALSQHTTQIVSVKETSKPTEEKTQ